MLEYDPHSLAMSAFTSQLAQQQQQQLSPLRHPLAASSLLEAETERLKQAGPSLSPRGLAGSNISGWRRLALGYAHQGLKR